MAWQASRSTHPSNRSRAEQPVHAAMHAEPHGDTWSGLDAARVDGMQPLTTGAPLKARIKKAAYSQARPLASVAQELPGMGEECKDVNGGGHGAGAVDPAAIEKLYEDVPPMPLMALNHISRLCKSVDASVRFYVKALGFVLIHRPPALDFSGAWYVYVLHREVSNKFGQLFMAP